VIEGKLVRLRPQSMDDVDRYVAWFNDPEVTEYLSNRYLISREAEVAWLRGRTETMMSQTAVLFAIETLDGVHIGSTNFHEVLPENRKARLGVTIGDKAYWSRGYGGDAVTTLCRFGFDEMNLHRIDLTVHAGNARAIRCYTKAGFIDEGRLRDHLFKRGRYHDMIVMGILREEFYALHGANAAS
jgi:RimJ/RimL family protein N-acetyltransferase